MVFASTSKEYFNKKKQKLVDTTKENKYKNKIREIRNDLVV